MARAAYTDLTLPFTLSASSNPTATVAATVITTLYKKAYDAVYGPNTYSADETTDTNDIIDSDEFRVLIVAEAEQIVIAMYQWERGEPWPAQEFTRDGLTQLARMARRTRDTYGNVRLWSHDYWDYLTDV